jgi:hypothetical protein
MHRALREESENPLPSCAVSPFSATVASKLVNTTSPFSSACITGTAAGAVARISDRIIDCPAKVIVIGASCGCCAVATVDRIANRTPRHAALVQNGPVFNVVAVCVANLVFIGHPDTVAILLSFYLSN